MNIFVSVASYCDELLFFTINDCIKKAKNPENIFFGIVDQNEFSQKERVDKLDFSNRIRYVYINKIDSLGVCWARNIAFSLWNNEEYLLQIDSHMCFEKNWDKTLKTQYLSLKEKSKKVIISTYPFGFYFDEENKVHTKTPSIGTVLVLRPHPDSILTEKNSILKFKAEYKNSNEPILGCHIAAGFLFTSSNFIEEIPYDPYLYFHGEEQSLSIRAFTKGWDIYHPTWIVLYHLYKSKEKTYNSHHWNKEVNEKRVFSWIYLHDRARIRLNKLLYEGGMKNSIYGLGIERTLEDFYLLSGIDYKNKKISFK